jgi:TRAP-type C4-dicarboxylate transport system permease small subunit
MRREATKAPGPQWEEVIAVASMALLVVITLLNVVTRYLTDESFGWTEEISVFLMVVMTLSGASVVARGDRHIRIEFFLHRLTADGKRVPRRRLLLFAALACSLAFMALAALFARWAWDQYRFDETSMGLGLPLWWYGAAVPPLCLAVAVRAFSAFLRVLKSGGGA